MFFGGKKEQIRILAFERKGYNRHQGVMRGFLRGMEEGKGREGFIRNQKIGFRTLDRH